MPRTISAGLAFVFVLFVSSEYIAFAQINPSPIYGTSTGGGSGGTPTGPTNPGGLGFGTSNAGASGGLPTGPLNPNAYGWGTSTGAGSGGTATGPTVRGLQEIPPGLRIMTDDYGRSYYVPSTKHNSARIRHRHVVHRAAR